MPSIKRQLACRHHLSAGEFQFNQKKYILYCEASEKLEKNCIRPWNQKHERCLSI